MAQPTVQEPSVDAYPSDKYVLNSISPYLSVKGAAQAIELYRALFGAEVMSRMERNKIVFHAELKIGNTVMMLGEDMYQIVSKCVGPLSLGIYVPNVDEIHRRAIEMGCCEQEAPKNYFWGDRMGSFIDPYGVRWGVSQRLRNLTDEQLEQGLLQKITQERESYDQRRREKEAQQASAQACHEKRTL